MTRDQIIAAADRAAQAVWNRKGNWLEPHLAVGMKDPTEVMAALLARPPSAHDLWPPAEALYRAVSGAEVEQRPWSRLKPAARFCFETFRGVMIAGQLFVAASVPDPVSGPMPETMRERMLDDEGPDGMDDRVVMR